jgi:hypothetical protein
VGRICDELNANDRLRAHEDSKIRVGLPRAQTTIDQRNLLLDAVRRTAARDGQTLASFTGLAAPKALSPVRHDTGAAWNRNLARVRAYAQRLDGAGTRAELVAALVHLSTLRPSIAADHVTVAAGLERLGAAECDLQPQKVTPAFTLPPPRAREKPRGDGTVRRHRPAVDPHPVTGQPAPPANAPPLRVLPPGSPVPRPVRSQPSVNTPMPAAAPPPPSVNAPGAGSTAGGAGGSGG